MSGPVRESFTLFFLSSTQYCVMGHWMAGPMSPLAGTLLIAVLCPGFPDSGS
jgi:hypothetical protein